MDEDDKRRSDRRNRPAPNIDTIAVPLGNNNTDISGSPIVVVDEVSTIYGGKWNPTFYIASPTRLEDTLGYIEEGYAHASTSGTFDRSRYDPNTFSQLRLLGMKDSRSGSRSSSAQHKGHADDVEAQRQNVNNEKDGSKDEQLMIRLRKQQYCVEGVLVTLIVLSILALAVVLVLVLRR